jgi:hypothetical protein
MKLQMASIVFLFGCGVGHPGALMAAPTEPQSETPAISAQGAKYEHRLEMSRFDVGDGVNTVEAVCASGGDKGCSSLTR